MEDLSIAIYKYVLTELIPQFLSTLVVFCAIIVISQMVRLSDVLVAFGISAENIFLPFLYIVAPFLVLLIPISALFSTMLFFSRISADGELTAFLAAGLGLRRIMVPTLLFGALLYGAATFCGVHLEAWGRREFVNFIFRKTQTELDNVIRFKIQPGVFVSDFLDYVFYAEDISKDRTQYKNVILAPQEKKNGDFLMTAPSAQILGSVEKGDLRMIFFDGYANGIQDEMEGETSTLKFKRAEIDLLRVFQEKILDADSVRDDYRGYSAKDLAAYVEKLSHEPPGKDNELYRASFLMHSRKANPFIVFAFVILGMIWGIQDQRSARNRGYAGAIFTLMVCFILEVPPRWLGEHGYIPTLWAAWIPQILIFLFALYCLYQKNRLPPSEPILAWRNFPGRQHFQQGSK